MSCPTAGGTAMQNGRPYARGRERATEMADKSDCGGPGAEREEGGGGGPPCALPPRPPPRSRSANIVFGREKIRAAGCFFAATAAFRSTPEAATATAGGRTGAARAARRFHSSSKGCWFTFVGQIKCGKTMIKINIFPHTINMLITCFPQYTHPHNLSTSSP